MADPKLTEADHGEEATLFPKTAGERLREMRESQGLALAEIAARTRVPIRHLEAIEKSDFSALPSPTYAVGFAKAYARAVGLDEALIGREIRATRDVSRPDRPSYQPYEASDPARVPPRGLAMVTAMIALVALVGFALWYGSAWLGEGSGAPVAATQDVPPAAPVGAPPPAPAAAAPVAGGPVVLTASDVVWLRIYDGDKRLYEAEMKPGDRYEVPGDAAHPMINVGRPDKLAVTVGGRAVPPLGTGERAIKDVEISAAALLARASGGPAPAPSPSTTPSAEKEARGPAAARRREAPARRTVADSDADAVRRANAAAAPKPEATSPAP